MKKKNGFYKPRNQEYVQITVHKSLIPIISFYKNKYSKKFKKNISRQLATYYMAKEGIK